MSLRSVRSCGLLITFGVCLLFQSQANQLQQNASGQIYQRTTKSGDAQNNTSWVPNDCMGLGQSISSQIESLFRSQEKDRKAQLVNFYMTSRDKPLRAMVSTGDQFGLEWTDFRAKRDTIVIVHGFLSNGKEPWIDSMAKAFLKLGDYNVIAVDWSVTSETYNYYKAVVNTQTTGDEIATLFDQIAQSIMSKSSTARAEQWGQIHCVGHSLGAHICGYAANEMKRRNSSWVLRRITGLDPAQPCFHTNELALKLDKQDAPFVDVIHTNGRFLSKLGFGLPEPMGHVDFFPNGGKQQPGCQTTGFTIPIISIPTSALSRAVCHHGRSYVYFTESILNAVSNKCVFWAQPWDRSYRDIKRILITTCKPGKCTEMGINSVKYNLRGTFFVLTAATGPFCDPEYKDRDEIITALKDDFGDDWED
ncbi:hypothetical protein QAD02_008509 [Eretmocerus hayati]|uniref:Uncharacterized protein n=1 Tax=Eretmocerus hayati TaxID=131215 RepID=A0ACC2N708_9HYME|nr:hypothetical protein QAD02_008509 [Eretmocerus hayati]